MNKDGPWSEADLRAMARDPDTSSEMLHVLAINYPLEVSENPAFPLLFVENPALLDEWSTRATTGLLTNGRLPDEMFRLLALDSSHPERRSLVLGNPFLPADLCSIVAHEPSELFSLVRAAAEPTTAEATLRSLAIRREWHVRAAVARNPSLPIDEVEELSLDEVHFVRASAAEHPGLPAHCVRALMTDLELVVRQAARRHPQRDEELARVLDAIGDPGEHRSREPLRSVPVAVLESLAQEGPHGRWLAARHPDTPVALLAQLAYDECEIVVAGVAGNAAAPPALLASLKVTSSISDALFCNPATPAALRASLKVTNQLRDELLRDPTTPSSILEDAVRVLIETDLFRRFVVAAHPNVSPGLLDQLSRFKLNKLQLILARHPKTPPSALARLSIAQNPKIRAAVALQAACPPEVRAALACDPDARVRRAAMGG